MANVQYYDVILKPVITEKSMAAMAEKKYTFLVHPEANKTMIKETDGKCADGCIEKSEFQKHVHCTDKCLCAKLCGCFG